MSDNIPPGGDTYDFIFNYSLPCPPAVPLPGSTENFSTIPAANSRAPILSNYPEYQASWQIGRHHSNQNILGNLNRDRECFVKAAFLVNPDPQNGVPLGWLKFTGVFISPEYSVSFIFHDTLKALGYEPSLIAAKKVFNPRGGQFIPLGVTTLYIRLGASLDAEAFYINALVLGGKPEDAGAQFIMGKPDIQRILGTDWTPERCAALGIELSDKMN
ncbi:hypothetical protein B0T14DRAFT_568897 [Immersiella caudata]|uniref:Uncharacterized protein n=1 Tax=Immersiella caudata TaxID=314043 RepID=A0AA40BXN5_9PEZI|nr:hypothetical protein B0T14DRAFT_568897 [Immersiella caudata]